jgi:hypothetical protein
MRGATTGSRRESPATAMSIPTGGRPVPSAVKVRGGPNGSSGWPRRARQRKSGLRQWARQNTICLLWGLHPEHIFSKDRAYVARLQPNGSIASVEARHDPFLKEIWRSTPLLRRRFGWIAETQLVPLRIGLASRQPSSSCHKTLKLCARVLRGAALRAGGDQCRAGPDCSGAIGKRCNHDTKAGDCRRAW